MGREEGRYPLQPALEACPNPMDETAAHQILNSPPTVYEFEMERAHDEHEPLAIGERDTLHWALNELAIHVFEVMLKELGVSETLALLRPRVRYSGRVLARNFAARFNLESGSLEAIAFAPFCARCLIWGGKGKLTFYERGAINEFVACPMSQGPPEICIALSHYVGEGVSEEMNPDFEVVYTHHMTQGDPCCVGVCRRKDELGIDAEHLGTKLRVVESLDIGEKEMDALSFNEEVHMLNILLESFLESISADRVSQLLSPAFKALGVEAGRRAKSVLKESNLATTPDSILMTWGEMLGQAYEVKDVKQGGLETSLSGCICCHSPMTVCDLMESFLAGMISAVSPGTSLLFVKCKDASHDACRIVFQPELNKNESASDPLVTLKMRFVNGEISEEEYRKKRAVLLER